VLGLYPPAHLSVADWENDDGVQGGGAYFVEHALRLLVPAVRLCVRAKIKSFFPSFLIDLSVL
jgi:hypothetical protein